MAETAKPLEKKKKSDVARDRILAAARKIFAVAGYEGTTVRAIAAEAVINPSMVIRYFGSKEGLFAAVANLDVKVAQLSGVPKKKLGEALVRHVLQMWEHPEEGAALAALMRASISNEAARERIVAQFWQQIAVLFYAIEPQTSSAAPFIATQMLGLAMARYIWKIPAVVKEPSENLVKRIGKTVQRYLDEAAG